jgi:hypothetical protein
MALLNAARTLSYTSGDGCSTVFATYNLGLPPTVTGQISIQGAIAAPLNFLQTGGVNSNVYGSVFALTPSTLGTIGPTGATVFGNIQANVNNGTVSMVTASVAALVTAIGTAWVTLFSFNYNADASPAVMTAVTATPMW